MKLGQLLKELRAEESLRNAAKRIGISSSYLAILEKGIDRRTKKPPKPEPAVLRKIAIAYKYEYLKLVEAAGYFDDPKYNSNLSVAFPNNPTLQQWYKQLPQCKEEDVEKLMNMWNLLHSRQ